MKAVKRILLLICSIIVLMMSYHFINLYSKENVKTYVQMKVRADVPIKFQLFFSNTNNEWKEENSSTISYNNTQSWQNLKFLIPEQSRYIRLDTGSAKNQVDIKEIFIRRNTDVKVNLDKANPTFNQLSMKIIDDKVARISLQSTGNDPFLFFDANKFIQEAQLKSKWSFNGTALTLAFLTAISVYFILRYIKDSLRLIKDFMRNRELILNLAKNDFKTKYASSYLGILWGFINPLLTIATYWFVFQIGLRNGDVGDVPFIIWFIAGIIPWFFFSDALSSATNVFTEYSYLVKKVVFKIELLPLVKIMSAFFVQLFFIVFIFIVYAGYGRFPTLFSFQLLYYLVCLVVLAVSISFFTSAIFLFFRDLNQIIAVILQMGFWFTPIGWSVSMLSDTWARIFKLNPMYYIVQGYRDSLVDHILFFNRPYQTAYFWLFCLVMFTVGLKTFKKLKPHFSDVL
ncbi:ABC transporter permease [Paenibacillus graminis]|uniref:ABC transporter permease n=1 Tax=Paenibacillus graminis TaxID=189425 RepID=UPI002DBA4BBE|nr:ABC transporter permease [Paenibacillus graminis]MEC0171192.1 ABC transporter permease [Paenibacillus graminis]